MERNRFLEWLGFRYVLNKNTGEIHDLRNERRNCRIDMMTNVRYIFKRTAFKLMKVGKANGCRYCLKRWDTG